MKKKNANMRNANTMYAPDTKSHPPRAPAKSQSAMEYLMTYGWAILIIAVILAAFFSLGFFNQFAFAPKAQPGSCQVFRSVQGASLVGECLNYAPEYASTFGSSPYDQISVAGNFFVGNSFSVLGWVYWPSSAAIQDSSGDGVALGYIRSGTGGPDKSFGLILNNGGKWSLEFGGDDLVCGSGPSPNTWYQFGATWNSTTKLQTIWVNGLNDSCYRTSTGTLDSPGPVYIGGGANTWGSGGSFAGTLSNVQIYNNSLSPSSISALYGEGIGGDPVDLQNLVGWWPLNGNTNDYSGNNNYAIGNNGFFFNQDWYPV